MGDPGDRDDLTPGSSWRKWTRLAAATESDVSREPAAGEHDDEFGLDLDWPASAGGPMPAHTGSSSVDSILDDDDWLPSTDDDFERAAGSSPIRSSEPRRPAPRLAPADAEGPALGPLLPAMYKRLDLVADRVAAMESEVLERLSDMEGVLLQSSPGSASTETAPELAADLAEVRRQVSALRAEAAELRDLVTAALGQAGVGPDADQLHEVVGDAVRVLRGELRTLADDVSEHGADIRAFRDEVAQLRRRVGVRARPPQLDDASIDRIAELIIERLSTSFEVVADDPPPPTPDPKASRRRRGTR